MKPMKTIKFLLILLIALVTLQILFTFSKQNDTTPDDNYYNYAKNNYRVFNLYIPDQITFLDEKVPLDNYYVRERLERELFAVTFWHSRTFLILKRSRRYFPLFEKILKEYSIPDDFKYLAMAESELTHVVSPAGAESIWQFLKKTAIKYDLEINDYVDERYNVEKSTYVACQYLIEANKTFKNWTLSAAAYNTGSSRVVTALKEQQVDSYYNLTLLAETNRYIYRILAYKLIYENPTRYGFFLRNKDLYHPIPVIQLEIDTTIANLYNFAIQNKSNYLLLKEHNTWLRDTSLPNKSGKKYIISIPKHYSYNKLISEIENPYHLMNDSVPFP